MSTIRGKVSWFGGPDDTGVSPDEGLAFIYEVENAPDLFLPEQPPGTTGLARRLDPNEFYIACRWDYDVTPKPSLLEYTALVRAPKTGRAFEACPADWGPHEDTDRVADISPGLMEALGIQTDDEVEIIYPYRKQQPVEGSMPFGKIVISSGHGKLVRGASGILDEVDEARRVVEQLAKDLRARDVEVMIFHDDESTSQNENLERIVDYHNSQQRDLDVSVHFNAYVETENPMGCEVLWVTQSALASQVSAAIAECGFIDRGGKKRTDLYFLNNTEMPSILLEICFVDSTTDADVYGEAFGAICQAIADVLGGELEDITEPPIDPDHPRPPRPPIERPAVGLSRVDIEVSGPVIVMINRVPVN